MDNKKNIAKKNKIPNYRLCFVGPCDRKHTYFPYGLSTQQRSSIYTKIDVKYNSLLHIDLLCVYLLYILIKSFHNKPHTFVPQDIVQIAESIGLLNQFV